MNILVIYYTQTGQILDVCESIFSEIQNFTDVNISYKEIKPIPKFDFPWTMQKFFDVFPDSVSLNACELDNSEFTDNENYDLIVLAGQVWYLSPSIPISSFLQSEEAAQILNNKNVVTIYGVRNMWVNAHKQTQRLIKNNGGNLVGNIVLSDRVNNLVSVITIVRWLIEGKKEARGIWPAAGIMKNDILEAKKYGRIIYDSLLNDDLGNLQANLLNAGAIKLNYTIMKTEQTGGRIFRIWNDKILKRGNLSTSKLKRRLKLFKYYLYFAIFAVSPFASIIFKLKKVIFSKKAKKEIYNNSIV